MSPVFVLIGLSLMEAVDPDTLARRLMHRTTRNADLTALRAAIATRNAEIETSQQVEALRLATQLTKAEMLT